MVNKHSYTPYLLLLVAFLLAMDLLFWGTLAGFFKRVSDKDTPTNRHLSVGTNIWPGYEPFYLAQHLGLFEGESIKINQFGSNVQVITAFQNKVIQAATLTLDEALRLRQYSEDVSLILLLDFSNGGDGIVAHSELGDLSSLKGKRIGVENSGLGAYLLTRALNIHHIDLKEVTLLPIRADEHERAFSLRKVDAVVTFEPMITILTQKHQGKVVFDSREIPREVVDVLVIRKSFATAYPEQVQKLIRAWKKALEYIESDSMNAYRFLGERLGQTPAEVVQTYKKLQLLSVEESISLLAGEKPAIEDSFQLLANIMKHKGLINKSINFEGFIDAQFLEEE